MRRLLSYIFLLTCLPFTSSAQKISLSSLQVADPQNTYVAIIANEDYQSYRDDYIENALHAVFDAERFMNYLVKVQQIPTTNISYYPDALAAHIKLYLSKLGRLAEKNPKAELIYYFSGKCLLNREDFVNTLLIPVDVKPENTMFAVSMQEVLTKLNHTQARKVTVYVDAADASVSRTYSLLDKGEEPVSLDPVYRKITAWLPKEVVPEASPAVILPGNISEAGDRTAEGRAQGMATETAPGNLTEPVNRAAPADAAADKKPPALVITNPSEERLAAGVFTEKDMMIKGFAFDENGISRIIVNGEEASLLPDGSFIAHALVLLGPNTYEVIAMDAAENVTLTSFSVERTLPPSEPAADTRSENISRAVAATPADDQAGYYALIIGIDDYQSWEFPDLDNPVTDARKLYNILTSSYSFPAENVVFLENPNREAIISAFDKLEYKLEGNDNLLIFYAGHGLWNESTQRGYWLPADASFKNTANWIDNNTITGYISGLKTRHTLVIADACFSGGIFKTRAVMPKAPEGINRLYELPSRKAMTSGTLTEVPDVSVFMYYLTKNLGENQEKYLPAEQLFHSFKPAVLNNSDNIPQFGVIKNSGDEGGDFIFIRK